MAREKSHYEKHYLPYLVGLQLVFRRRVLTGDVKTDHEGGYYSGFMLEINGEWIFVTAGHCLAEYAKYLDSDTFEQVAIRFVDFLHPDDHSDNGVPVEIDDGWHLHQDGLDIDYGFFRFSFLVRQCLEQRGVKAFSLANARLGSKYNFEFESALLIGLPAVTSLLDKDIGAFRAGPMLYRVDELSIDEHVVTGKIHTDDSIVGVSGGPIIGVRKVETPRSGYALIPVAVQSKWNGKDRITAHRTDCVANVIIDQYFNPDK